LDEAAVAAALGGEAVEVHLEELAEAVAAVIAAEEGLGSPASKVVRRSSSNPTVTLVSSSPVAARKIC
jgi:hypothetical protein